MRDAPSDTAAWVAAARGLAITLPADARLADDPYGIRFGGPRAARAARWPRLVRSTLGPFLLYMQVRTRVIDDVLRAFAATGGRQVLILGAGYDARAARFADELDGVRVFEVDHPATQARKRQILADAGVAETVASFVPWDFERRPMAELPAALAAVGHDPRVPTLTIWEGVTMYLSEAAIDASVRAVAALSAPGSSFVVSYLERRHLDRPRRVRRAVAGLVAWRGEPFRFGWDPELFPAWIRARGFEVTWDRETRDRARELLPERHLRWLRWVEGHHIALVTRT